MATKTLSSCHFILVSGPSSALGALLTQPLPNSVNGSNNTATTAPVSMVPTASSSTNAVKPSTPPPPLLPQHPVSKPAMSGPLSNSDKSSSPPNGPPVLEKAAAIKDPYKFTAREDSNSPKPVQKPAPPGATICRSTAELNSYDKLINY